MVQVKIQFDLGEEGWDGSESETLWAEPTQTGFVLDNIPFFKKGVCYQDVVEGEEISEGLYRYVKTLNKSTNSLYRILFEPDKAASAINLLHQFEKLDCFYETNEMHEVTLVAINISSSANIDEVWKIIGVGKDSGVWDVQTGDDRHQK